MKPFEQLLATLPVASPLAFDLNAVRALRLDLGEHNPALGGFDPEAVVTPGIHVSAVVRIPRVATQAGGFKNAA